MFEARSHDFGNIARAAKAEFAFELTNLYLEDVHIASVRASCGCTTPRIEKDTLKTYEKGAIIAHINSDRFLGNQGATITVTIDKPQYAQVQLHVKVYVYSDVLLEPSSVALGSVAQGNSAERTISVQYTGRSDWQIVEVRSDNPHLTGTVTETSRQGGQIAYDLKVVLDKDAPVGYVSESVWLITNDPRTKQIPVPVEGASPGGHFGQPLVAVPGRRAARPKRHEADCGARPEAVPHRLDSGRLRVSPGNRSQERGAQVALPCSGHIHRRREDGEDHPDHPHRDGFGQGGCGSARIRRGGRVAALHPIRLTKTRSNEGEDYP